MSFWQKRKHFDVSVSKDVQATEIYEALRKAGIEVVSVELKEGCKCRVKGGEIMQKKVFVAALIKVEQKDDEPFDEFVGRIRAELSKKLDTKQLSLMVA